MVMDATLRFFTRTGVLATGLVLALLLNILTVTSELVFDALSKAVGAVSSLVTTKPVTVKARHAQQMERAKHVRKQLTTSKTWRADAAQRELASVKRTNIDLQHRHALVNREFDRQKLKLKRTVKVSTTRMSRRVAQATARNATAIFAEAIPYLGIPVLLTSLGLDIKDACDNMKDLHALDVEFNPESVDTSGRDKVCGMTVPTKQEILNKLKDLAP